MLELHTVDKPRILVVANLDRFLRHLKPHLLACRAAGFRVDIACRVGEFEDEIRQYCDHLYHIPIRRNPLSPENIFALQRLTSLIKNGGYDIVHSHTPVGGMIGRLAATRAGVPIRIYMAHGFHFHPEGNPAGNFLFSCLERWAGQRWSDIVQVINHEDYMSAISLKIATRDKLICLPGVGVDTSRFDPDSVSEIEMASVMAELELPRTGPLLGVVAEFIPRKRIEDAIHALAIIRKEYPQATLLVLGEGPGRARLEQVARSVGVESACRFPGFQRDLPVYLSLMDLFVFPTRQEGLPVALMEAMSMGIPVVATDIRGNRDVVTDGKTGLLVPVGQPEQIAASCLRLLSNPKLAQRYAREAQKVIRKDFDTKVTVVRQMEIYEQAYRHAQAAGRVVSDGPAISIAKTLRDMANSRSQAKLKDVA
jgi:glycosyltransferase involved in cell wall biosynthesis